MRRFKVYLRQNHFYLLFPLLFILISVNLLIINGSFLFESDFLHKVGDQKLYYSLAHKLALLDGEKSYYTLGYPLLYLPFILLTGIKDSWTSIMPAVISLQAFIMLPSSIYLIFKTKTRKYALISFGLLCTYYFFFVMRSEDILTKYTFFGLIPLSEPLSIFLLLGAYHTYLKYFYSSTPKVKHNLLLSILITWGVLTRNISVILYLPLFIDLLLDKKFRTLCQIGVLSIVLYTPQLIYNFLVSGDVLFNGYKWNAALRAEKNSRAIESLYGVKSSALFSFHYFTANFTSLFAQYLPLFFLATINVVRKNRFLLLVVFCSCLNLILYLAYWWSKAGGLMDRFLLPNVFLLLYIYKNSLIAPKLLPDIFIKRFKK